MTELVLPESYREGIKVAERNGIIVYEGTEDDTFSPYDHIENVSPSNTRMLDCFCRNLVRAVVPYVRKALEIGPGAGAGLSDLSRLLPEARLEAVGGLQPVNPYLRFKEWFSEDEMLSRGIDDIVFAIKGALQNFYLEKMAVTDRREWAGWGRLVESFNPEGKSMDMLLQIQRQLAIDIFEVQDESHPYVHFQRVGPYENTSGLVPGSYDLVFEQFGPHHHEGDMDMYARTLDLLSDQGIAIVPVVKEGRDFAIRRDDVYVKSRLGDFFIIKRSHPNFANLRKMVDGLDFMAFSSLSRIQAL